MRQRLGLILMQNNGTIIARPRWEEMAPFCRRLLDCTEHQHLLHALLPLYLLAGLAVVCCWLRERRDDAEARSGTADNLDRAAVLFVAGVATAAPLCDVAAVFLCSRHNVQPRYLFACWLLPFLFVGLFVQLLPAWLRKWGGASSRLAIVVFALYRLGVHGAGMDCTHFEPPYPACGSCHRPSPARAWADARPGRLLGGATHGLPQPGASVGAAGRAGRLAFFPRLQPQPLPRRRSGEARAAVLQLHHRLTRGEDGAQPGTGARRIRRTG